MEGAINWVAVLVAMVGAMVTGFIWYSPVLFVKPWMRELGKTPAQMGNPAKAMLTAVVMHLVTAICMALIFRAVNVEGVPDAIATATVLWAGFAGATQFAADRFHPRSRRCRRSPCHRRGDVPIASPVANRPRR